LYASYGFLYSYVLSGNLGFSDDKRVPGVPVHTLSITGTYESKSLHASITGSYQGMRYLTTANLQYQPAVFLLGFRLEWFLDIRSSLYLKGENLLNERYESVKGFPMPGLSMEMGLEYKLGKL
jgi:vitamin B12 transporter